MLKNPANPASTGAVELTDDELDAVSGGRRGRGWRNTKGTLWMLGLVATAPWAYKRQKRNKSYKKAFDLMVSD